MTCPVVVMTAKTKRTVLMRRAMTVMTLGAVLIAAAASAQQASQPQTPPAAATQKPAAAAAAPAQPPAKPFPEGSRIAFIDVQRVASESTEGKAAAAKINDLNQKRTNELAAKNKALDAAQQKLSSGGALMSEDARAQLQKDIDKQQVDIQRAQQDAQGELDARGGCSSCSAGLTRGLSGRIAPWT
jgi:Skp family chaperone for outer membrane proteins